MNLVFLKEALDRRTQNHSLRKLVDGGELKDFSSNDYLGLANNQLLKQRVHERLSKDRPAIGGTGSRLISGNHGYYTETEKQLSGVFRSESALVFSSGYAANQALVSSVAGRGDTILYDQLAHVCIKEGAWLSKANSFSFKHNDLEDLERRLRQAEGRCFVAVESVYSMDGDLAPLVDLVSVCENYGAYLIVDEAHSVGVYGEGGGGLLVAQGLEHRVFARVYTFGKAMGVHGACVAGSELLIDFLINYGRAFIYTTSLPPHSLISIQESFTFLKDYQSLQADLQEKIYLFTRNCALTVSTTAIQPIMIGGNQAARLAARKLQEAGLDIRPILAPTVPKGTERLRISLHVHNGDEDIAALVDGLSTLS